MPRIFASLRFVAAALLVCTSLFAQSPNLTDGKTYVTFTQDFLSAADSLGLSLGVVVPTQIVDGTAGSPIFAGTLELDNARGQILHSGGLTISKGDTNLRLQSFIIDTTASAPVITGIAVVNDGVVGRLPLFNVILPSDFTLPLQPDQGIIDLKYPDLTLTAEAAGALNHIFRTDAFQPNFRIAFARIIAAGERPSFNANSR